MAGAPPALPQKHPGICRAEAPLKMSPLVKRGVWGGGIDPLSNLPLTKGEIREGVTGPIRSRLPKKDPAPPHNAIGVVVSRLRMTGIAAKPAPLGRRVFQNATVRSVMPNPPAPA